MKVFLALSGAVLTITGACLGFAAQDDAPPKSKAPAAAKDNTDDTDTKDTAKKNSAKKDADKAPAADNEKAAPQEQSDDEDQQPSPVPAKYAADEKAIREVHQKLIKGYCADDAKAVADLFTEEGEYINSADELFQGRDNIQKSLGEFMKEHAGCNVESHITDIRFLGPNIAAVEGRSTVKHDHTGTTRCTFDAVYSKNGDKWQIASIHDEESAQEESRHEDHLAQLDFLNGEWIDEEQHSIVSFTCAPTEDGKFLVRNFAVTIDGREVMSGSQRIGWDPLNSKLRMWIFDSEGGFSEGTWQQRSDNEWVVRAMGVTGAGQIASANSIYKIVNDHTMTWQSVDHEINGVAMPDSPVFTLTHRSPSPGKGEGEPKVGQKP